MKLIMEGWRGFLQEGRYEAATTDLTRKVMPHVKFIIDDVLTKDSVKNSRKDLTVVIPKRFERGKGLPKELDERMYSVSFKFNIDKKLAEETGDKFQIGGAFMSDPYDPSDSYMVVNSYLDIGFNEQDLNDYLGQLKGLVIHELQHGGQTDDVLKTSDPRTYEPMGGFNWNYNQLKGVRGYYASEAEVDSYTKEIYKRAKYYKKPYTEVLDKRLQEFFDMFRRRRDKVNAEDEKETPGEYRVEYTEDELRDFFFKELRPQYIEYAKTKYPEAVGI